MPIVTRNNVITDENKYSLVELVSHVQICGLFLVNGRPTKRSLRATMFVTRDNKSDIRFRFYESKK